MGLDFDITAAAPDGKRIAAVQAELAAERQRLRSLDKRFLIVAGTLLVAILSFVLLVGVPVVNDPSTEVGIVFITVYTLPYLVVSVFVVGNTLHHSRVEVPRKALRTAEAALQEGARADIDALSDAWTHAPLGAYQRQVASQGRVLLQGEVEAMRRWLDEHDGQAE